MTLNFSQKRKIEVSNGYVAMKYFLFKKRYERVKKSFLFYNYLLTYEFDQKMLRTNFKDDTLLTI